MLVALVSGLWMLSSCAGYRLGHQKPEELAEVEKIHVPLVKNLSQIPRAAASATNALVDAVVIDGTYQVATTESADAVLEVELYNVSYRAVRTVRENRLRSQELAMTVELRWKLRKFSDTSQVVLSGKSSGRTSLFVDPNIQTAQQSAFNDALQRAATSLVVQIAHGF